MVVNTPLATSRWGIALRLHARLIGHAADCPLSQDWERARERVQQSTSVQIFTPLPSRGEGAQMQQYHIKAWGLRIPYRRL